MSEYIEDKKKPDTNKKEDKPKPCCVCKEEKSARDECLLFKGDTEDDGYIKCKDYIEKYKECMKGYGFEV